MTQSCLTELRVQGVCHSSGSCCSELTGEEQCLRRGTDVFVVDIYTAERESCEGGGQVGLVVHLVNQEETL